MSRATLGESMEPVNEKMGDRMDHLAEHLSNGECQVVKPVPLEKDLGITKYFPYFVVACLVGWIADILYLNNFTFSVLIENLCLVFVTGFALLGMYCTKGMEKGPFPKWALFLFAVGISALIWWVGMKLDFLVYANAVNAIMNTLGIALSQSALNVISFLVVVAITFFTTIGVLTVTVAYLRVYLVNVFKSMEEHAKTGVRAKAETFFMVPDIIDVKGVELEPEISGHEFNISSMTFLSVYMVVLAMMISSYLFVNPLFLSVMSWKTMLSIMLMLSMFVPVLIIPWQIVKELGARVVSDAPRPYYLWTGAKWRLFYIFATLGAFMMMIVLSVYFGFQFWDILGTYIVFLIPLVLTTLAYSLIYANNFSEPMKISIADRFMKWKCREENED